MHVYPSATPLETDTSGTFTYSPETEPTDGDGVAPPPSDGGGYWGQPCGPDGSCWPFHDCVVGTCELSTFGDTGIPVLGLVAGALVFTLVVTAR